jgi:hypothetical protein
MRKLIAAALGLGAAAASNAIASPPYAPYSNSATNEIYNLLFCDEPGAFKPRGGSNPADWQMAVLSEPVDSSALRTIAADTSREGRVRYLAYARLRQLGEAVPAKVLLGVIVEVPLADSLDVLAAFSEGGVRYLNQSGKLVVFEGAEPLELLVRKLLRRHRSWSTASVLGISRAAHRPRRVTFVSPSWYPMACTSAKGQCP